MNNTKSFLKSLMSLSGLSGYEEPVRTVIADTWRPLVDEMHTSPLGSLHCLRYGSGYEPRKSILLMAHMDAVGLMVTRIVNGFLRITEVGGVDPRILPGQQVIVHGRQPIPGIIVQPTADHLPPNQASGPVAMEYLFVDTGLEPDEVASLVRVGDLVSFAQEPIEMSDDVLAGHSLDNRASVAALTECLQLLQKSTHAWDVWVVASVQEEETLGGAFTSAYAIRPDLAVAVDVTYARGPGSPSDYRTFPFSEGLTIGWGANIHQGLYRSFKNLAEQLEIPFFTELMPGSSGTDGMGIQVALEGIPTMVLGIPIRYMHTPVEAVSMKEVSRTGCLLAEFINRLQPEYLQSLSIDGEL